MKTIAILTLLPLLIGLSACGGDDGSNTGANDIGESGLSKSLLLSDLDDDQKLQLCQWQEDLFTNGSCPDSADESDKREATSAEECAVKDQNYVACDLGLYEDCVTAISQNLCAEEFPGACDSLFDCMEQLSPPFNCHGGVMCFP